MKTDDFERHLSRQPLRPVPAEWRGQILRAAVRGAAAGRKSARPSALVLQLQAWLWPHPAAWAGLAACWAASLALHLASAPSAAEVAQARAHARLAAAYASLLRNPDFMAVLAEPPPPAPAPPPPRRSPDHGLLLRQTNQLAA